jgi:hypothetical protein
LLIECEYHIERKIRNADALRTVYKVKLLFAWFAQRAGTRGEVSRRDIVPRHQAETFLSPTRREYVISTAMF